MTALTVVTAAPEFLGEVHPYAARFPMLADPDLDALAADIAAHGLLHPLVLTPTGALLDGRNRLAACERCGVTPDYVVYDGDPVAFVIGQNMQRRDLTQAQKAHLLVCSDSEQTVREVAAVAGVPASTVAEARVIRRHTPAASDAVIAGTMPHDKAYTTAKGIKDDLAVQSTQRAHLEAHAPDILGSGLPLAEAWAAYQERTRKDREKAEALADAIRQANVSVTEAIYRLRLFAHNADSVRDWLASYDPKHAIHAPTSSDVRAAIDTLTELREGLPK